MNHSTLKKRNVQGEHNVQGVGFEYPRTAHHQRRRASFDKKQDFDGQDAIDRLHDFGEKEDR